MQTKLLKPQVVIYPELSYQITGILFDVYNTLGNGLNENVYQRAIGVALKKLGLHFAEQVYVPINYEGKNVGKHVLDFLIEDKVILEIKRGDRFAKSHIDQLLQYLHAKDLKLGILAYFAPNKLHFKRLVNSDSYIRNHS